MRGKRGLAVASAIAALTACYGEPEAQAPASAELAEGDERIDCALNGAAEFERTCAAERIQQEGALYLIVRHPDGAFRRFEVLTDGRGLIVADGAEEAKVELTGDLLEVEVDDDRYRFPAARMDHAERS